jgi:D-alanyl-D-alanine carboxypeptidase/D-alanyl-D-alanine-endopeptidase (penicillin-binding protein 4)
MRNKGFICSIVLASFLFCSASKPLHKDQIAYLQNGIERIVQTADPSAHVGIEIISLKDHFRLYQKNAEQRFIPASVQKFFTAAAALSILGVDFRFETKLLTDGSVRKNALEGNLYLKGSGDPELTIKDLEEFVFQLQLLQIHEIKGDLIIDISDFDQIAQGPGWMWDQERDEQNSPLDALTVNHSCINLWVEPANALEEAPTVYVEPKTNYVLIQNLAVTTEGPGDLSVSRSSMTKDNLIQIQGEVSLKSPPVHYTIAIDTPHLYAAQVFSELLKNAGIALKGNLLVQKTPLEAKILTSHFSSPLRITLQKMMKTPDNLYANCLFKKMGQFRYGAPGNWQKGGQAVRTFLEKEVGLDLSDLVLLDGDGQSRYNLCTPHQVVDFLMWTYEQFPFAAELMASLPIGGVDGELEKRLTDPMLKTKVRAKPGAMPGISSLAGYLKGQNGETFAFCIMINGFVKKSQKAKNDLEDQICAFLAKFAKE